MNKPGIYVAIDDITICDRHFKKSDIIPSGYVQPHLISHEAILFVPDINDDILVDTSSHVTLHQ